MKTLTEFIANKQWDLLIANYTPKEICQGLSFPESMRLTKHIFYDDMHNDEHQKFGLALALEIKDHYQNEWVKDWKNEVFLGDLYSFQWLYDEQYACYKSAYDKSDRPAELLLLMASCKNAPGKAPITKEESEEYLKKSIEKKLTYESALMMRTLFEEKKDKTQTDYWDKLYKTLEKENICSELIIPDVFRN